MYHELLTNHYIKYFHVTISFTRFHQRILHSLEKKVMGETNNKCILMELYQVLPCDIERAISYT